MRLLKLEGNNEFSLTHDIINPMMPYAILSHTWGDGNDEVNFRDFMDGSGKTKDGYRKIRFCGEQAQRDGLQYFWVDTCCIDKSNHVELSEAINSMFRWYRDAAKCYVYLADVPKRNHDEYNDVPRATWKSDFRNSRWFTRGWTLQELIAPASVEFFSHEGIRLGDKRSMEDQISEITNIPAQVLRGGPLSSFSVDERISWGAKRNTAREEDGAYCLLGIFDIYMPLIYGEREQAFSRLRREIDMSLKGCCPEPNQPEILQWISRIPYEEHHNTNRRGIIEGTGSWLLQHNAFTQWKGSTKSSILWLHGIPGSGKTKLTSIIIDELLHTPESRQLAYFYCARNAAEPERSNPEDIFRSLLRQLCFCSGQPLPLPITTEFRKREGGGFASGQLSLTESVDLTIRLTKSYPRMTIVLDALDECNPETRHYLLESLDDIIQKSTGLVKIFVSSRDDKDVVLALNKSPNVYIKSSDNAEDIKSFIEFEVGLAIRKGRLLNGSISNELRQHVVNTLKGGSQGMFRWVSLQLQSLCSMRMNFEADIRGELERLPQDLMDIYSNIYDQIADLGRQSQRIAERALKWILCSKRRLSVDEFLTAISINSDGTVTRVSKEDVLNLCCNLVMFDTEIQIFRFAHLTVGEFLAERDDFRLPNTHSLAAETCLLVCLRDSRINGLFAATVNNTLYAYAASYWPHHCCMSKELLYQGTLGVLLHEFLMQKQGVNANFTTWSSFGHKSYDYWEPSTDDIYRESMRSFPANPVFAACILGSVEITKNLVREMPTLEVRNLRGETCLYLASKYGQYEIVQLFLQHGAEINAKSAQNDTAVFQSTTEGHVMVTKLLLEEGADFSVRDKKSNTLLHQAADIGNGALIELLLAQYGTDIDSRNTYGYTPLVTAIQNDHITVVTLLLDSNASVYTRASDPSNALSWAIGYTNDRIVRCLLDRITPLDPETEGILALELGINIGSVSIVRILLSRMPNPPRTGIIEMMKEAIKSSEKYRFKQQEDGHDMCFSLLLQKIFNEEYAAEFGSKMLSLAAYAGWRNVSEILIEGQLSLQHLNLGDQTPLHELVRGYKDLYRSLNSHDYPIVGRWKLIARSLLVKGGTGMALLPNATGEIPLYETIKSLLTPLVNLLLESGVALDVTTADDRGTALLIKTASNGEKELVELLLKGGADVKGTDESGKTALHWAVESYNAKVVQLLLESGADIMAEDDTGQTPLHVAASDGSKEIVQILLQSGADIEATDSIGQTAWQVAARSRWPDSAVILLLRHGVSFEVDIERGPDGGATRL